MRRTELLQEIRKMRFEEAYEGWNAGRLMQAEAVGILGMSKRNFRRYLVRFESTYFFLIALSVSTCRPSRHHSRSPHQPEAMRLASCSFFSIVVSTFLELL